MESKTRKELLELCKERGLRACSSKTKAELIELIENGVSNTVIDEGHDYVFQTMMTCIGNKRKLVKHIYNIALGVAKTLGKDKLAILDGFAGSGVVSRQLSLVANKIIANDLELYSYLMCKCYLETPRQEDKTKIYAHIDHMNRLAESGPWFEGGFVAKLYAPKNTSAVQHGERCFYTRENAIIIDTLRKYIRDCVEEELQVYCLVPLLNRASIHVNTAGVFKGFYKRDGVGHFGGAGENALERIMRPIRLDYPTWSTAEFESKCYNKNINEMLVDDIKDGELDLIYLDPPYNQHPYGSNYFMLNLIATGEEPEEISKVAGIPVGWNKSDYNSASGAKDAIRELIEVGLLKSRYILLSYNDEGFLTADDWEKLLDGLVVRKHEIRYDTYKGCRNLETRNDKVMELMYLISR